MTADLINKTACQTVDMLKAGKVSPTDLLGALEKRIAEVDPAVNALPTLCFDRARQAAKAMEDVGLHERGPLAGMPVTTLYCAANLITSLEPLRDMPLTVLNCSANPISSLEPLRGMNLVTLICESCPIPSLEPIEGMPLTMLNCGGTLCNSLEPLQGMRLQWISFWGCGVTEIDALEGMAITSLFCDANEIEDLSPLVQMAAVDAQGDQRFAPFWHIYLAGNPLSEDAKTKQLEFLKKLGARIQLEPTP